LFGKKARPCSSQKISKMSLSKTLPKPKSVLISKWISDEEDSEQDQVQVKQSLVPAYPNRKNWIPESQKDFNSGGAYPEIHVLQYPLEMGRKGDSGLEQSLALQTDENGKIKYDLVLHKNGQVRKGKIIHSSAESMREKDMDGIDTIQSREELQEIAQETQQALDVLVNGQVAAYKPRELGLERAKPTFVKYVATESDQASTRIVRVSEVPIDPLEPPRFKHRKIPRSTGSPPPPVLRSPPRKVSAEEQKNWIIPPCISNWKNAKGYTIPLDKRLANDGIWFI
jgi:SNW domain-containing protein 1